MVENVRFAPGVQVTQRGPNVLQFGADATRTGLVRAPDAASILPVLRSCGRPRRVDSLVGALAAHMEPQAAESLVHDLIAYRILVPAARLKVLATGAGPLASRTAELLSASGVEVRFPLREETLPRFMFRNGRDCPLIAFNSGRQVGDLVSAKRTLDRPFVPVTQVDARVFIGPIAAASGPCPMCAHLYHVDRDSNWNHVVDQVALDQYTEPLSLAAGAAAAALVVRRLLGVPDAPGVSAPPPGAGTLTIVDPFAPTPVAVTTLPQHPDCPVCY